MSLLAHFASDLAPPEPLPSPTPTTPADIASGTVGGLDAATIAIVVLVLLVIAGTAWVLARRKAS